VAQRGFSQVLHHLENEVAQGGAVAQLSTDKFALDHLSTRHRTLEKGRA
jgi:hypothetical protein